MFIARDENGKICARCGMMNEKLTKDHFIPKSCKMNVNEEGNYVAICKKCNEEKANKVVMPDWYLFLADEQKEKLLRYMKYARSYVLENIDDEELAEQIRRL